MSYKVMIWGTGKEYDEVMSHLRADIIQGVVEVIALISTYREPMKYLDGKIIILPEEIKDYVYDYVLIANKEFEKDIKKKALEVGISNENIIGYNVLSNELFDFNRYIKILESKISIVSDDCWGGYTYNSLSLPFNTPFINLFPVQYDMGKGVVCDDYYKLISNLEYYLKQPLKMLSDGHGTRFSIGCIGDVRLNFNHHSNFSEAKKDWDRRVKRFNFKNYIVKKNIYNDEDAKRFSELPISKKIGFYNKDLNLNDIICLKKFKKSLFYENGCDFAAYVRTLAGASVGGVREYDVFKLLTGEKDFLRCK